ncbi:glycosyltransferase family 4 protein [bacterium]|nr:glycosyltransferase family 4 protein [bacterium]
MKIAVIHQYYLLPGASGGSRFNEMTAQWAAAGCEVTVIAGTVDYATGQAPARYRRRLVTEERDGDVRVLRCHVPTTYARGYLGRMWAFLGFIFSSTAAVPRLGAVDVVVATSPPLVTAIPGWLASRRRGRRPQWIFEVRDLWPESAVTTGVLREKALLTRLLYRLEAWAYRRADHVSVLTPAFARDIADRGLAPAEKITLLPNGADLDLFQPGPRDNAARRELGWGDRFVVMYAGAHGKANALHQLVGAAELLADRPDILIACVGDGPERAGLAEQAARAGLTNIVFHGAVPKARMPGIVNACDVGAAVLQDNPTFRTVYPNKVFDYMACRRPVLLAIDGVAREMVCDQARAGVFARPEDPAALAAAIRALADDPQACAAYGARGSEWVRAHASRRGVGERYLELMRRLAGTP